jgi:predicted site-specific integrase-resolvase
MDTKEKDEELVEKILHGLELSYKKLYEYKKRNNQELVLFKDNKIVRIKP